MTVNKERVALLVADLRTTTEPQAKGYLKSEHGFCCLGRGCEVAIANGLAVAMEEVPRRDGQPTHFRYNNTVDFLPTAVRDWYGFDRANPILAEGVKGACGDLTCDCTEGAISASRANDDEEWDFAQIADALEARYINGDANA